MFTLLINFLKYFLLNRGKNAALCGLFVLQTFMLNAQMNEAMVKALFIYNFSKYIEWPQEKSSGSFIIGVAGDIDVFKEIEQIGKAKRVNDKPILVKKITEASEVSKCHIVFISEDHPLLKHSDDFARENGVLIVTENNSSKASYAINILLQKNKIRFEINETAARKAGLKISNELILLAAKNN